MRQGREAWILGVLLLIFVAATAYYTQRGFQSQQREQPTTYSVGQGGTKALYVLLQQEGVDVRRFERPFTELPADAGLVVMFEPLPRDLQAGEQDALQRWIEAGGALLLVTSEKGIGQGVALDRVRVETAKRSASAPLAPEGGTSAYLRDVRQVQVGGALRLINEDKKHHTTLIADDEGAYALAWHKGEGAVVVVTDGLAADNGGIGQADNAIFFVNIAQAHARDGRSAVLFDEYHQGFGFEAASGPSLWQALGAPMRMVAWYLLVAFLILLYNVNRRFGAAKRLEAPSSRPSTEYIVSMAGFFRRAGAADIALETIYKHFVRDLAVRVDAPPDALPDRIAEISAQRYGWNAAELRGLMSRCETLLTGARAAASPGPRLRPILQDGELLRLAQQIQDYRRKADLVRLSQ